MTKRKEYLMEKYIDPSNHIFCISDLLGAREFIQEIHNKNYYCIKEQLVAEWLISN